MGGEVGMLRVHRVAVSGELRLEIGPALLMGGSRGHAGAEVALCLHVGIGAVGVKVHHGLGGASLVSRAASCLPPQLASKAAAATIEIKSSIFISPFYLNLQKY